MKLENQVVNRELSQEIEKLGVKQDSLWWWFRNIDGWSIHEIGGKCDSDRKKDYCSAFTVAELGEMLPFPISRQIFKNVHGRYGFYTETAKLILADTEADARAKLFIYLIEKKLMKVEK